MRYPRSIFSRKLLEALRQPGLQCKIPRLSLDSKRHKFNLCFFADIWFSITSRTSKRKLPTRSEAHLSPTKSETATHLSPVRSETRFSPTSQVGKTATRFSPARSEIVTSQVGNRNPLVTIVTSQVGNCHQPGRKLSPARSETRFSPPVRSFRSQFELILGGNSIATELIAVVRLWTVCCVMVCSSSISPRLQSSNQKQHSLVCAVLCFVG